MRYLAVLLGFLALTGAIQPGRAQDRGIDWGLLNGKSKGPVFQSQAQQPARPIGQTCFIKGEQESGQNKMCFYDCLGSTHAENIASYAVCPVQIRR